MLRKLTPADQPLTPIVTDRRACSTSALRFRGIASTADSDWNEFANDDQEKVDEKPDDGGLDSLLDDDFNIDRF